MSLSIVLYLLIGVGVWFVAYTIDAFLNGGGDLWCGMRLFKDNLSWSLPGGAKRKLAYIKGLGISDESYAESLPGLANLLFMCTLPLTWFPVILIIALTWTTVAGWNLVVSLYRKVFSR